MTMPSETPLPDLPMESSATSEMALLAAALRRDVQTLAVDIGPRHLWRYESLQAAAGLIEQRWSNMMYRVHHINYAARGRQATNLEVEIKGDRRPDEIIVVGAHYDTRVADKLLHESAKHAENDSWGTPGADDNATGVAAVLHLSRMFAARPTGRTLRFVAFVNEEPPMFQTSEMGSLIYAQRCRDRRENIVAMMTPETLGYYTDQPHTQRYPFPYDLFMPRIGNFIAFISNLRSRRLLRQVYDLFRMHSNFPVVAKAVPAVVKRIGWSDDWAFWRNGYPALTITDTAYLRNRHYHTDQDTPEKLDFDRMAHVVAGLHRVIADMAQ